MQAFKRKLQYWISDIYKLGFYHILSVNVLATFISFASQIFVVWLLTAEEIGQIRVMQSFLSYSILLGALGFNTSTLKVCSENRSPGEVVFLYKRAVLYSALFAILVLIIFLVLNHFNLLIQNKKFENPLSLLLLTTFPMVINSVDISYLQARREFKLLSRRQLISKVFSITLIISFTYIYGFYGFIIATISGYLISFVLIYHASYSINKSIEIIKIPNSFHVHLNYAGFSFLSNLAYQASLYFDMLFLNYLVKDDVNGIGSYGFATIIISFFTMITITFQQVLTPLFSNAASDIQLWNEILKKYTRIFYFGITLLALIGILVLPFIIHLFFGTKFPKIEIYLSILWISWYLKSLYALKSTALFGVGKIRVIFLLSIILVIISIPLNYTMTILFGVIGTGFANLIASFLGLIAYIIAFNKSYKSILLTIQS